MNANLQNTLKRYGLLVLTLIVVLIVGIMSPDKGNAIQKTAVHYLIEMLSFIPPVFILAGLLDVWVPRQMVEGNVGPDSGLKGVVITMAIAVSAAGPLYVAFPLAKTLYDKGARLSNVILFLNTWATIKVPMILNEIRFIGVKFALLRLVLTIPIIVVSSYVLEKMSKTTAVTVTELVE